MFVFMIPECIALLSIAVIMWFIAVPAVFVTLVVLCIRGKNPL